MFCVVAHVTTRACHSRFWSLRDPEFVRPLGHLLRSAPDGHPRSAALPPAVADDRPAEAAIRSARELAERSANEARAATAEFEQRTSVARAEIYKQMDEMRRAAMAERADILRRPAPKPKRDRGGPRRFRLRPRRPGSVSPPTPTRSVRRPRSGFSDGGLPDLLGLSTRSLMFSSMMIQHPSRVCPSPYRHCIPGRAARDDGVRPGRGGARRPGRRADTRETGRTCRG